MTRPDNALPSIPLLAPDPRDIAFNVCRNSTGPVPMDDGKQIGTGLT